MNRICMPSRIVICRVKFGWFLSFDPGSHLRFWKNLKLVQKLVCGVKYNVYAKFCPNQMNGIYMPRQMWFVGSNINVWPLTPGSHLGSRRKNSLRSLLFGTIVMSMPIFIQPGWIESVCRAEMWFVGSNYGSNLVNFYVWPLASILDFEYNLKFIQKIGNGVK